MEAINVFYNHLILSGTKISKLYILLLLLFYNHLILSGTKILALLFVYKKGFYNHLILSGTKIVNVFTAIVYSFTIT